MGLHWGYVVVVVGGVMWIWVIMNLLRLHLWDYTGYVVFVVGVMWILLFLQDEIFHIPQAQQYCKGNFRSWDPMITTPPGMYVVSRSYSIS